MTRQCPSCGGFCSESGCERDDAKDTGANETKLPPLPEPLCNLPGYCRDAIAHYICAAIEADRQARGEPAFFTYLINGHHRGISETEPPDDSYDEGTLQKLYATPQQTRASCQGKNCGATNGQSHSPECIVEAATAQGWAGSPEAIQAQQEIDSMNRATPQPQQIPEGYKQTLREFLTALDKAHMLEKPSSAWGNGQQGSVQERLQAWAEVNRLRAMLEAATEPKGEV